MPKRKINSQARRGQSPTKIKRRRYIMEPPEIPIERILDEKFFPARRTFVDPLNYMATVFDELRENEQLCDGVIKTEDGKEFKIHRAVVSAGSPYFRAMFSNRLLSFEVNEVLVPGLISEILALILDFIYTKRITITVSNVEKLLAAADLLQVWGVVKRCCAFLAKELKIDNCIGIFMISKHYFCPSLAETAKCFIMEHFELVSRMSPEFSLLPCEDLRTFLLSDDLNVSCEGQVFDAIIRWTERDLTKRKQHLLNLLTAVRFGLCERTFVRTNILTHQLLKSVPECKPLLTTIRRLQWESKGKNKEDMFNSHNPVYRPRIPKEILFAIGGWSSEGTISLIETFDIRTNRWFISDYGDGMPRAYHGVIALDNLIYMIGGFDGNQCYSTVRCFNPLTQVWEERACMHRARCYVSVTALDGLIYAMGGYDGRVRSSSCERYDPKTNQWTIIANMNRERSDASASTLRDKVYIAGGFTGHEIMNSAEVYDPKTNQWTYIQRMQHPRSGVGLQATKNSLYVLGGFNGNGRMSSVERYNPERDSWTEVAPMNVTRSNFTTAVLNGKLYVIGGFDGSATITKVEYYDEQNNEWTEGQPMNINRSALSACVLQGLRNSRAYTFLGNAV